MKNRTRYIFCGLVDEDEPISNFRLIAGKALYILKEDIPTAIRVVIPNDLVVEKFPWGSYSTTKDNRTIKDLGYDVVHWNGKKWEVYNELKGVQPHLYYRYFENMNTIEELRDSKIIL